jgi:hypothetical protein
MMTNKPSKKMSTKKTRAKEHIALVCAVAKYIVRPDIERRGWSFDDATVTYIASCLLTDPERRVAMWCALSATCKELLRDLSGGSGLNSAKRGLWLLAHKHRALQPHPTSLKSEIKWFQQQRGPTVLVNPLNRFRSGPPYDSQKYPVCPWSGWMPPGGTDEYELACRDGKCITSPIKYLAHLIGCESTVVKCKHCEQRLKKSQWIEHLNFQCFEFQHRCQICDTQYKGPFHNIRECRLTVAKNESRRPELTKNSAGADLFFRAFAFAIKGQILEQSIRKSPTGPIWCGRVADGLEASYQYTIELSPLALTWRILTFQTLDVKPQSS